MSSSLERRIKSERVSRTQTISDVAAFIWQSDVPAAAGGTYFVPVDQRPVVTYDSPFGGSLTHHETDKVLDWDISENLVIVSVQAPSEIGTEASEQPVPIKRTHEVQDWIVKISEKNPNLIFLRTPNLRNQTLVWSFFMRNLLLHQRGYLSTGECLLRPRSTSRIW